MESALEESEDTIRIIKPEFCRQNSSQNTQIFHFHNVFFIDFCLNTVRELKFYNLATFKEEPPVGRGGISEFGGGGVGGLTANLPPQVATKKACLPGKGWEQGNWSISVVFPCN